LTSCIASVPTPPRRNSDLTSEIQAQNLNFNLASITIRHIMSSYTVSPSPRGRALFASRAITPGTLIDTFTDLTPARALVLPAAPSRSTTCAHCLSSSASLKRCTACRSLAYCSPSCQKADWKAAHKQECPVLVRAAASVGKDAPDGAPVPTAVRAVVRIILAPAAYGGLETELNGHFEKFEEERGLKWADLELQARVLMGWLPPLPEGEEATKRRVMNILCKVGRSKTRFWTFADLADPNKRL
jgi:MYND finger protein